MEWVMPSQMAPIPTYSILNASNEIEDPSQLSAAIPDADIVQWYKNMLTINIMDSIMFDAQRHGRVSFYMVSAGEEAIMTGSAAALGKGDIITCQYREHGVFLQRGFELKDFMSQLTANCNDPGKGRNMPNHYTGREKTGIHSVASTLGTQIPHAVGAAYALKLQDQADSTREPRVGVAYFGEGATSEGDFHGALNMAATMESPVIFICRNNGYAISTPASEQYRGDGIACRGIAYGIEALRVDGTDIFAVYEATKEARRKAVEGRPILLEFMSYRISHHSTSDDSTAYRNPDDIAFWKGSQGNPISRLRQYLVRKGLWSDELDVHTRKEIRRSVIRELTAAEKEKKPALKDIFTDVYAELTDEAEYQREKLRELMKKYPAEYDVKNHVGGLDAL
ncbi:thiamine diphosphate-binding protein [Dactylonectria estremocensis]|uniref:2-oxoisovalerate dehydrogenase subunit alpha n=1 Tax=Dactylonectria estremocensis TaxID=1079267 RepID=A0A9P9FBM5_9HYPO|nr:thiamine diphosphate-binding protein [Dactylonectria estremocensis]